MSSLHLLDFTAMAIYFAILIWIGIRVAREEKGEGESESFLAADRNMNLVQSTCSTAATDLGGGFSIAMGGLGFTLGISGSWLIAASGLSILMVSFLMVPKVKRWSDRVKGLTTGDLFEARFDRRTGLVAAIVIGVAWFAFVGGQIIAGGKLLQVTLDMDLTLGILLAGGIILAYTAMGGLKAVIYTDVFQMFVLMIGILLIALPIGLYEVGGIGALFDHFESDPETASLVDWTAVGWKQLIGWFFAIFPVWFISIAAMQRIVAARDEQTARRAFFLTGVPIEWPLFAIGSTLIGLIARMLLPDLADPELATPMIRHGTAAGRDRRYRHRGVHRRRDVVGRLLPDRPGRDLHERHLSQAVEAGRQRCRVGHDRACRDDRARRARRRDRLADPERPRSDPLCVHDRRGGSVLPDARPVVLAADDGERCVLEHAHGRHLGVGLGGHR